MPRRPRPVGQQAEPEDPRHDERGHDGTLDEQLRDTHLSPAISFAPSATPFTSTGAPEIRRSCPSVTTSSPARTPWAMTVYGPAVRATETGCECAVPS